MEVVNQSHFTVGRFVTTDSHGRETMLLVVKATYDLSSIQAGHPALAAEQDPLVLADRYHGEPGSSSIAYASDCAPFKPATDVALIAHAYPATRGATQVDVSLRVGPLNKTVRVYGDRFWQMGPPGLKPSRPAPIQRVPMVWERAFGGADDSGGKPEWCAENPCGVSFCGRSSTKNFHTTPLPNLEDPRQPLQKPAADGRPVAFGFVAPHWMPRAGFAGTYNDAWMQQRMPLLPLDFDPRFHHTVPADQVLPGYLRGGEEVCVEGATGSGRLSFRVPAHRPMASVLIDDAEETPTLNGDTLIVDADRMRANVVWRGLLDIHTRIDDVERIWFDRSDRA